MQYDKMSNFSPCSLLFRPPSPGTKFQRHGQNRKVYSLAHSEDNTERERESWKRLVPFTPSYAGKDIFSLEGIEGILQLWYYSALLC